MQKKLKKPPFLTTNQKNDGKTPRHRSMKYAGQKALQILAQAGKLEHPLKEFAQQQHINLRANIAIIKEQTIMKDTAHRDAIYGALIRAAAHTNSNKRKGGQY